MVAIVGDNLCRGLDRLDGVAHGNTQSCGLHHFQIVALVAYGDHLGQGDLSQTAEGLQTHALVDSKGGQFKVQRNSGGIIQRKLFQQFSSLFPIFLIVTVEVDLIDLPCPVTEDGADIIHPKGAGIVQHRKALAIEILHIAPSALFHEHIVSCVDVYHHIQLFRNIQYLLRKLIGNGKSRQRPPRSYVEDQGAAETHGIVHIGKCTEILRHFRRTPSGGKEDLLSACQTAADRIPGAGRDLLITVQHRAVHIHSKQAVVHLITLFRCFVR